MADLYYYADWNNNGLFDHPYSDLSAYVILASWRFGRNAAHEFDAAGRIGLVLDNSTSLFSSENTASPLYGKILPNIAIKITMTSGGVTTTMAVMDLEDITPIVGHAPGTQINTAELVARGRLARFNKGETQIALQENKDTGALMTVFLDQDGYPADERSIDTGQSTIAKFWAKKNPRLKTIRSLQAAEFGRVREGKNGYFCFEGRAHIFAAPHDTPQATYGTGVLNMWNLRQGSPRSGGFDKVTGFVHTFNISEDVILVTWTDVPNNAGGTPLVVPGAVGGVPGTLEISIEFPTASSPANFVAVNAWSTLDMEANTAADRTGQDLTSSVTLSTDEKLGQRRRIVFSNANAAPAHLVVLRAHGVAVVEGDPIPVSSGTGDQEYPYPSDWWSDHAAAQAHADYLVGVFDPPPLRLTFDVKADYDANHLDEVRQRDIGDRIRVVATLADFGLAIDAEFIIDSLAYAVGADSMLIMTVACTKAPATQLAASGTPYTPRKVPTSDRAKVPDDLRCVGYASGTKISTGVEAWKWKDGIYEAEFRARLRTATALERGSGIVNAVIRSENNFAVPATGSLSFWINFAGSYGPTWEIAGPTQDISAGWLLCSGVGEPAEGDPDPPSSFGLQAWGNTIRAGWKTAASDKRITYTSFPAGEPVLVGLSWANAGDVILYVNGVNVGSVTGLDATFDTSSFLLSIMTGLAPTVHGFGGAFGKLSHLAFWDAVLTPIEMASLMQSKPDEVNADHLTDYWPLTLRTDSPEWYHHDNQVTGGDDVLSNDYIGIGQGVNLGQDASGKDSMDLRTPEEGGDLVHDGVTAIIAAGKKASQWGANHTWTPEFPGDWFYAYRLKNLAGWSVWSDGDDYPKWVTDHINTQNQNDTGPPEDWTVKVENGPKPGTVIVRATRPLVNGNTILFAMFQIKDGRTNPTFLALDSTTAPAHVYYDGSAIAHTYDADTFRFTRNSGSGFGFPLGTDAVILIDVRGDGNYALAHTVWTDGIGSFKWEGDNPETATWFEMPAALSELVSGADYRIKFVRTPWLWDTDGYLGATPGMGFSWKGYYKITNDDGSSGDKSSAEFVSDPIQIPDGLTVEDVVARVWFFNAYSASDDGIASALGTLGGVPVLPIVDGEVFTDARLGKEFVVYVTGNFTLKNPTNLTDWGHPIIWTFVIVSPGVITLDTMFRVCDAGNYVELPSTVGLRSHLGARYAADDELLDVVSFMPGYAQ